MARTVPIALLLSVPGCLCAQSWCPPGATWTYTNTDGWTYEGMARYTYAGDTVMAGSSAQIITRHSEGHFWPQDTVLVSDGAAFFTRVEGARVDLWNGAEFDTLYNFAAVPGDHWQLNTPAGIDPFITITVQDTGHITLSGLSLRYLVTTSSDTIIERLGSLPYHFVPWALAVLDAASGPLRCYADADIDYHAPAWPFGCASIAGVAEAAEATISISPNPGTGQFTVTMPPGAHDIRLCDATGRLVLRQLANGERAAVNTLGLPAGLYLVRVDGAAVPMRWVKE